MCCRIYLNSPVVSMRRQAKRTKGSIHAVQAVHITFTLMRICVNLAMNKEPCLEKRLQPWRPLVFFIIIIINSSLHPKRTIYMWKKRDRVKYATKINVWSVFWLGELTMILLLLGLISLMVGYWSSMAGQFLKAEKRELFLCSTFLQRKEGKRGGALFVVVGSGWGGMG